MLNSISSSSDLATVLNAQPLTDQDARETPRDWLDGIWVAGEVYPLDAAATTDTLAVLANGTGAVSWSPKGAYCSGSHRTAVESQAGHWCAADTDSVAFGDDVRGVTRDWRQVTVWDSNGYLEHTVYGTLAEAKETFDRENAEMSHDWNDQEALTDDDEEDEIYPSLLH
ncbi:hypothetical protein ACGFZS_47000 [Streptomyces sp. NPDC048288]|uniref:hypothetical protein n=1 Tax=Streptomyces sp. NPDC048288 TaxID=3365529 RepID=UPI0037212EFE